MTSMIVSTNPEREILDASPELASAVGSSPRFMCGVDCAEIVRCRNSQGTPLCADFCPLVMALRSRAGVVEKMPVWLENTSGELEEYEATFQRIPSISEGMVVARFAKPEEEAAAEAPIPAMIGRRRLALVPQHAASRRRRASARRRGRLQLLVS